MKPKDIKTREYIIHLPDMEAEILFGIQDKVLSELDYQGNHHSLGDDEIKAVQSTAKQIAEQWDKIRAKQVAEILEEEKLRQAKIDDYDSRDHIGE